MRLSVKDKYSDTIPEGQQSARVPAASSASTLPQNQMQRAAGGLGLHVDDTLASETQRGGGPSCVNNHAMPTYGGAQPAVLRLPVVSDNQKQVEGQAKGANGPLKLPQVNTVWGNEGVGGHDYTEEGDVLNIFSNYVQQIREEADYAFFAHTGTATSSDQKVIGDLVAYLERSPDRRYDESISEYGSRVESYYIELLRHTGYLSFVKRLEVSNVLFRLFTILEDASTRCIADSLESSSPLSLYPYYLALISLRSSDTRVRNAALYFLQANHSAYRNQSSRIKMQFPQRLESPPWWNKSLAESPEGEPPANSKESILQYRALRGNKAKEIGALVVLKATLRLAQTQFLAVNFENLTIARRLLAEQDVLCAPDLPAQVRAVDVTFCMLPDQVIVDVKARLDLIGRHEQLSKKYRAELNVLNIVLKDAEDMERASKLGGDLYSQVSYLMWNDTAVRKLNTTLEKIPSAENLKAELGAQIAADSLIAGESVLEIKLGRKARRRAAARKIAAASGTAAAKLADSAPQGDGATGEEFGVQALSLDSASVSSPLMPQAINVFAVLQEKKHTPKSILELYTSIFEGLEKGTPCEREIGGFGLPTHLAAADLMGLLGFMSPGTFDVYAKSMAGDRYFPNLSSRAYSLLWHMRKHFDAGPEKLKKSDNPMTAEEFIHDALTLSANSDAESFMKTSAANPDEKVSKKYYGRLFGIFDQYNRVVTFGYNRYFSWK